MTNNSYVKSGVSLGTYVADGVRSGPQYSNLFSGQIPNIYNVITSNNYSNYGPGILFSPINTYNIKPAPGLLGTAYNNTANVVAVTAAAAVPNGGYLTLTRDNSSTFLTVGPNGGPLLQLDVPRVITATVTAGATVGSRVTIFGYDYYNYPMQQTYILAAGALTYPTITQGAGAVDGAIFNNNPLVLNPLPGNKAFYQITGVYFQGQMNGGGSISLGAADVFGLPYVVRSKGVISSIAWGSQTVAAPNYPNPNTITPINELTARVIGNPLSTVGIFVPADLTNPATQYSGDPRGLYAPSTAASTQVINGVTVDAKNLLFTSYIAGADTRVNQINADQVAYMQANNAATPLGVPIAPLNVTNLYGVPQFYTGLTS